MAHGTRTGSARTCRHPIGLLLLLGAVGCSGPEKVSKEPTKSHIPLPSKLPSPSVGTPTASRPESGIQQVSATTTQPTTRTSPPAATVSRTPDPLPLPSTGGGLSAPTVPSNPAVMSPQPIAAPATLPPPVVVPETTPVTSPILAPTAPTQPTLNLGMPPADPRSLPAIKPAGMVQPPTPMTDAIPPMPPDPLPLPTPLK